jgi:hypothetical protein
VSDGALQVEDSNVCVMDALHIVMQLFLPFTSGSGPLCQEPFPAASLFLPSTLDSCFTLLDKLSRSSGRKGSCSSWTGSNWINSSNASITTTTSDSVRFGKGDTTATCKHLVRVERPVQMTESPPK